MLRFDTWATPVPSKRWHPVFDPVSFGESSLHINALLPEGEDISGTSVYMRQSDGVEGYLASSNGGGEKVTIGVPDVSDARFQVLVSIHGPGGTSMGVIDEMVAGTSREVSVLPTPSAITPMEGEKNVGLETEFSWSSPPGTVSYFYAISTDSSARPRDYTVISAHPAVRLPDTSALGVPFPGSEEYRWFGNFQVGASSVDHYAGGTWKNEGRGVTDSRRFTTAQ